MCRALREGGVEVLIAATDADGPTRLPVKLGKRVDYHGVSVVFFPRQWSESFKYSRPLERWLEANVEDFDLVEIHAVFSHSSLAAGRACQRHKIPYVMHPIGSLDPWCLAQKSLRKRLLWLMVARKLLRNAAAIHYTTTEEKERAEQNLGLNHGIVIPLGVNEELLDSKVEPEVFRQRFSSLGSSPYIITLCRIHPIKGLELLIEAFLKLNQENEFQAWKLVIAGDGERDYVASLRRLVSRLGGEERVIFSGWLETEEKAAALRGASLFALLSHHENFGLSVAEAMAFEVPVLVSRQVNLSPEIERVGAGWVVGLESGLIQGAITHALREKGERYLKGRKGMELVDNGLRWHTVIPKLVARYQEILSDS